MKENYEKIIEKKEKLKMKVMKTFTKLRNAINEREDKLLSDMDNIYNYYFIEEKIVKQCEKLPNEIKLSLERGKLLDNEWNNNIGKLELFINDCINIENNLKNIKIMKSKIENLNSIQREVKFLPEEENVVNTFIDNFNNFGKVIIDEEKNDLYISNLNSLIIKNDFEYNKNIKDWIEPNKKMKAELLYRLSRDGEEISKFHELCDNKGPTLTLFYVTDGNKGGIFSPISWDNKSGAKYDKKTFMFNLNILLEGFQLN